MLQRENLVPLNDVERHLFTQLVPADHFLRQRVQVVDCERFGPVLAATYCPDDGRPPLDPVFLRKLEVLALPYRLSDRQLMKQAAGQRRPAPVFGAELPKPAVAPYRDELLSGACGRRLALAHKVLADRDHPQAGDKVLSVPDADARRGQHGDDYDGYLIASAMDADSERITGVNVLPANGDEGGDAAQRSEQEEAAQGNAVEPQGEEPHGRQE